LVALRPMPDHIACQLSLTDQRDLSIAISRCRRMLDLDADPIAVDDQLRTDPVLAPLIEKSPGRRVPRTVDGAEFAVRAVLGQQVSTAAARTHASRLVVAHGEPVDDASGGLTHLFPRMEALAELDPESLAFPKSRRTTLTTLIATLAAGEIDLGAGSDWDKAREQLGALPGIGPWTVESIAMRALGDPDAFVGSDWDKAREQLGALPGIGPWTVESIAMRALGDPDAFVGSDLGIRYAARDLGLPEAPKALTEHARVWRPWRAYAVQYLWATGEHAINKIPTE